jgi:two-component system sensor histidine kinase TctE
VKTFWTDPSRFGIRARLLTLLLPGILGLLAFDSWNDYRAMRNLMQDAYDQVMLESVTALRASIALGADGSIQLNTPTPIRTLFEATSPQHKHLHVGLTPHLAEANTPNTPIASRQALTLLGEPDLPPPPALPAAFVASSLGVPAIRYDSSYRGYPVRVAALQSEVLDGQGQRFDLLIQAAESTAQRDTAQTVILRQQLWRDARMVLVVIVLVWLGVTWSLQPLERLRKSVLQRQHHALNPLDKSGVPHEVAPLVVAVNQQLANYRDLLDQQSQFLADASHQLRTPLAIMLTQVGFALREKDPAQLHETLRAITAQLTRSRRLCEQFLSLADASDRLPSVDPPSVVDLGVIAREVVLQYLALAHEKNLDLGWMDATLDAVGANGDRAGRPAATPLLGVRAVGPELHEALANLVHNAIAYTPSGGQITVAVSVHDGRALADVLDSGPGIAAMRREAVFKRFHHTGPSTDKSQHGAGLGLAIARTYARRNGGDITLADVPANVHATASRMPGLRATLSLPLALG